jgi:exopolysaccharide production protein ExoZ
MIFLILALIMQRTTTNDLTTRPHEITTDNSVIQKTSRLHNLDYLRGLAAFGIMIYHYLSWTYGSYSSDSFIGRVGVYGVSIFYVLSGLTLYHVYQHKMAPSKSDLTDFFVKRLYRIFPLLWLATIASLVLSRKFPDIAQLILNLSGLFGFIQWDGYIATGAWSIGNELVFYVFFPVFVLLSKRSKVLFTILGIVLFGIYVQFAFNILDNTSPLGEQWHDYVNPLNQVFLFLGGFLIGMFFKNTTVNPIINVFILITGLSLFIFYPVTENTINLVTGANRIVFTLSCFLICFSFYKLLVELPLLISKPLTLMGEASYSVYLLHPIVYSVFKKLFTLASNHSVHMPKLLQITLSITVTLIASYFVYEYFEKYFMKKGREINSGKSFA